MNLFYAKFSLIACLYLFSCGEQAHLQHDSRALSSSVEQITAEVAEFIDSNYYNWNWCVPMIGEDQIPEKYRLTLDTFLSSLEAFVFVVRPFCWDGGSSLILVNAKEGIKSIIPATGQELNFYSYLPFSDQGLLQILDNYKNDDMIGLEVYLNLLKPDVDDLLKADLDYLFLRYLNIKYQMADDLIIANRITASGQVASERSNEQEIQIFISSLLSPDNEVNSRRIYSYVFLDGNPGLYNVFIVKRSIEKEFLNLFPYRVLYYVM